MKTFISIITFFLILHAQGQQVYKITQGSEIIVKGTSTLHDWEMNFEAVGGSGTFTVEDNQIKSIKDLSIELVAEDLKSGKSGMDKNAYKAMNTDDHPKITYNMTKVKSIEQSGSGAVIEADGTLTIAGVQKNVPLSVSCKVSGAGITCSGDYAFQMTNYEIDPPTAMFGTIKTGNDLTSTFQVSFSR